MWDTIGTWLGTVAAIVAAIASVLVYLRQTDPGRPHVSFELAPITSYPGFLELVVFVQNTGLTPWTGETVEIRFPHDVEITAYRFGMTSSGDNHLGPNTKGFARVARLEVRVGPAGGEDAQAHFVLRAASSPTRISIRVSLRSNDARERRMAITATRRLTPTIPIATP